MAVKNYYTVNGKIRGQHVQGESDGKDYMLDASGNVVGVYQGDYMYANAAYDGFGNVLDSWNMSTFTNFTWGGGHGYRQTGLAYSSVYVRARHYSNMDAAWTTRDPLWPSEMPYGYVNGRVPGGVDPSGFSIDFNCSDERTSTLKSCQQSFMKRMASSSQIGFMLKVSECTARKIDGQTSFNLFNSVAWFLTLVHKRNLNANSKLCIRCQQGNGSLPNWPEGCPNECDDPSLWGYSYGDTGFEELLPNEAKCSLHTYGISKDCGGVFENSNRQQTCGCSIALCNSTFHNEFQSPCAIFFHEVSHCSNYGHGKGITTDTPIGGGGKGRELDFIYKLGCCICLSMNDNERGKCGGECDVLR
jgi:hypothetical protein